MNRAPDRGRTGPVSGPLGMRIDFVEARHVLDRHFDSKIERFLRSPASTTVTAYAIATVGSSTRQEVGCRRCCSFRARPAWVRQRRPKNGNSFERSLGSREPNSLQWSPNKMFQPSMKAQGVNDASWAPKRESASRNPVSMERGLPRVLR